MLCGERTWVGGSNDVDEVRMSVRAARAFADGLLDKDVVIGGAEHPALRRTWWAMGDPQAAFDTFAAILDRHGLLGADGRLLPSVGLVSIGDHFDFGRGPDFEETGRHGERILRFLAAHPESQSVILLGNHDTVRVQELAFESDESFHRARLLAFELAMLEQQNGEDSAEFTAAQQKFFAAHPGIPSHGVVLRDFSAFRSSQRTLVQQLLLARRVRLGVSATLPDGTAALINHAGFTEREAVLLGTTHHRGREGPQQIANALRSHLDAAVALVAARWRSHGAAALDLSPVHVAGTSGSEGGGLLYHRASNPDRPGADTRWENAGAGPRRYSPHALPKGLVQVCGHSGHRKLRTELKPWVEPDALAVELGGIRTLTCEGDVVRYRMGVHAAPANAAAMYLIDGEMNSVGADSYPLFRLGAVDIGLD